MGECLSVEALAVPVVPSDRANDRAFIATYRNTSDGKLPVRPQVPAAIDTALSSRRSRVRCSRDHGWFWPLAKRYTVPPATSGTMCHFHDDAAKTCLLI